MTWVMAQPSIFGQVILLSDIQVTFENRDNGEVTYLDCLQKSYAMDKNIVSGFAGNVFGGFALLGSLSKTIKANKSSSEEVYEPDVLIKQWSKIAARDFSRLKPHAREGGVHILIGGVSHTNDIGIPGMGIPTVAILESPDFKPKFADRGKWISIGSGKSVEKYKQIIDKATGDPYHPLMQHNENFYYQTISIFISSEVQKMEPVSGVSQHYNIACITRAGISGATSDHSEYPATGEVMDIRMPEVAHSLDEFLELIQKINKTKSIAFAKLVNTRLPLKGFL